jgi:hypothetical protein
MLEEGSDRPDADPAVIAPGINPPTDISLSVMDRRIKNKKRLRLTTHLICGPLSASPADRCPITLDVRIPKTWYRLHHSILAQLDGWCAVCFGLRINWDICGNPITSCSSLWGLKDKPWAAFFPIINAPFHLIPVMVARARLEKTCAIFIVPVWPLNGPPLDAAGTTWYQMLHDPTFHMLTINIRINKNTFVPHPGAGIAATEPRVLSAGCQAVVVNFGPLFYANKRKDFVNLEVFPITSVRIPQRILAVPLLFPTFLNLNINPELVPEVIPEGHVPLSTCDLIPVQPVAPSPLVPDVFDRLTRDYPFPEFQKFGVEGLRSGFGNFIGDSNYHRVVSNSSSLRGHEAQARKNIVKELAAGRMLGPFPRPPFPNKWCRSQARLYPLGSTPKHKFIDSDEIRLISDMSAHEESSVNTLFHNHQLAMYYLKLPDLLAFCRARGRNCIGVCMDAVSAYRLIMQKPENFCRFVSCLKNELGVPEFFVDLCNPFGSTQSQIHWECVTALMCWAFRKAGVDFCWNYVDNFFGVVPPLPDGRTDCVTAFKVQGTMHGILTSLGVPFHEDQVGTVIKGLGWHAITSTLRVRCPPARMVLLRRLLAEWSFKTECSVRDLQSITGLLMFIAMMHIQGKSAMKALFDLETKGLRVCATKRLSRKVVLLRLTPRVISAFVFWRDNLPDWEVLGASFPLVFYNESEVIECRIDASTVRGVGGVNFRTNTCFSSRWLLQEDNLMNQSGAANAPLAEGWGGKLLARLEFPQHPNSSFRILSDSKSFAQALAAGYSDNKEILESLLEIRALALRYNINFQFLPIPRTQNVVSDALATGRISEALRFLGTSHPGVVFSVMDTSSRAPLNSCL